MDLPRSSKEPTTQSTGNLSHPSDTMTTSKRGQDVSTPVEVDDAVVLLLGAPTDNMPPGEIEGITRLEKLVFLLSKESDLSGLLTEDPDFHSHHFGPFSSKVYAAIDLLAAAGLVSDSTAVSDSTEETWESEAVIGLDSDPYATRDIALTPLGRDYYKSLLHELPSSTEDEIVDLKERFASLPLRQLVRYVYRRYPEYTEKSKIRDSILKD
jgi:hypothetical protein